MNEVELIIWDAAPMTQRYAFEALNRTLKDIRGWKDEENRERLFWWNSCTARRRLLSNLTKKHKKEFNSWLRQIGNETAPAIALQDEDEPTWTDIPSQYLVQPKENPIQSLIDEVFPDLKERMSDPLYLQEKAILTPLTQDANEVNNYMFKQLERDVAKQ
ncbi:hypothetical protein V2J09_009496 [Rumex salicifolius]